MKFFNQHYKNISSASDEVELLLSLISPQAADIYTAKKLEDEFKRVLKNLKIEKFAPVCRVADYKSKCALILCSHPAVLTQLSFYKEEIKKQLRQTAEIKEIFLKIKM